MAVAGFSEEDLSIESKESILVVKARRRKRKVRKPAFFTAASPHAPSSVASSLPITWKCAARASLKNGLLHIDLVREIPEAMKPRKIEIRNGNGAEKQIEASAA